MKKPATRRAFSCPRFASYRPSVSAVIRRPVIRIKEPVSFTYSQVYQG